MPLDRSRVRSTIFVVAIQRLDRGGSFCVGLASRNTGAWRWRSHRQVTRGCLDRSNRSPSQVDDDDAMHGASVTGRCAGRVRDLVTGAAGPGHHDVRERAFGSARTCAAGAVKDARFVPIVPRDHYIVRTDSIDDGARACVRDADAARAPRLLAMPRHALIPARVDLLPRRPAAPPMHARTHGRVKCWTAQQCPPSPARSADECAHARPMNT
jgi:hypothetical protein